MGSMMMEMCGQSCILEHAHIGFQFRPSGRDICEFFLKLRIQGKELPCTHMIANRNLYEDHSTPWEILKSDDSCWSLSTESSNTESKKTKKVMYVFTMLKKKGERVLRKAGCGTWTGQNKKAVKNEEGHLIGYDRLLTFKVEDDKKKNDDHGNWTMHEYSLHPNDYNYAICKITKEENTREKLVGPVVVLQAYPHHQHMSNQGEPQAEPQADQEWRSYTETLMNTCLEPQEEEEGRVTCNNIDPLAVQEIFDENVFNKVGEPQGEPPLLDQEWSSFTETLNMMLEPPEEEEREACDQIDALALKELSNENVFNKLAEPKRNEDQEQQVLLVEQEEQQILLVEQGERPVLPMEQELQQLVSVEQEEQRQERERMACITHLATNFNYYYALQQQQLEGGEINSLGKRKNRSYLHEDELSNNKKQQLTFFSSLY